MQDFNGANPRVSVVKMQPRQDATQQLAQVHRKKRVCGYGRVSTDEEEQQSSYDLQVEYYTNYIKNKPDWEFVGMYADEGITGTSTKKRDGFLQMIRDCEAGKIDMIITKSISRFARNTLDCLEHVRKLKNLPSPVGIFFEKENLDTLDAKSELLLTILSSLAQDESRSISENVRWSLQKNYQQGRIKCSASNFLGYDTNAKGDLVINEEQAATVRRIYREYLEGKGTNVIAKGLMRDGVLTGKGNTKWAACSIHRILTNEKYSGDVLTSKRVITDYLTHQRVVNRGQVQQYLISDHHPAIISREDWNRVQDELKRRDAMNKAAKERPAQRHSSRTAFSNKLFCSECHEPLIRRTFTSHKKGEKYYYHVWQCRTYAGRTGKDCANKGCVEEALMVSFMEMVARLKGRDHELRALVDEAARNMVSDEEAARLARLEEEIRIVEQRLAEASSSARTSMVGDMYDELADRLGRRLHDLRVEHDAIDNTKQRAAWMRAELEWFLERLSVITDIEDFDEDLFCRVVNSGTVSGEPCRGEVEYSFKFGLMCTAYGNDRPYRVFEKKATE